MEIDPRSAVMGLIFLLGQHGNHSAERLEVKPPPLPVIAVGQTVPVPRPKMLPLAVAEK